MATKRSCYSKGLLGLIIVLLTAQPAESIVYKWIRVGNYHNKVVDSGDEGKGGIQPGTGHRYYYDKFNFAFFNTKSTFIGTQNWKDTSGAIVPYKLAGHGQWQSDDTKILMPVPDENAITIHRYMRYTPPTIIVDGFQLSEPWPFNPDADHLDATGEKIPGTADIMMESYINSNFGLSIHQKVYAFSQKNHDDYIVYDWTFINTGNIDLDPEIELPDQYLDSVYYHKQTRPRTKGHFMNSYGEMPGDSLRLMYGYIARGRKDEYDRTGYMRTATGQLRRPWFCAEAVVFSSLTTSADPVGFATDDWNQPTMTGYQDCDLPVVVVHSDNLSEDLTRQGYLLMKKGFLWYDGQFGMSTPEIVGSRPGHHSLRFEDRGYKNVEDAPWLGYTISGDIAIGPYNVAYQDSFRIVWLTIGGCISPEKGWEVGKAWKSKVPIEPPPGMSFTGGPGGTPIDNLPKQFQNFPELYEADVYSSAENNWAKDCWIFTGKDSLFMNTAAGQWAFDNDFEVPAAPPPPSITVTSGVDAINISWGSESEAASDFAGYRIYRALGDPDTTYVLIKDSPGSATHSYDDGDLTPAGGPVRGMNYYYYVSAYDDGTNDPGFRDVSEVLESGKYLNRTTLPASLTREPSASLDDIRVVPNPFSLGATELQYLGTPNKIMFMNLPPLCTIKIYTEGGDLIKTIEHISGSGDESWGPLGVAETHSATDVGQIIVSGIYLAYVETPEGESTYVKFVVVR